MKEKKIDNLKLEDEALKGVSGGGATEKTVTTVMCPYCHVEHEMVEYRGSVHYDGKDFRNVPRYVCSLTSNMFYIIVNDRNKEIFLDINYNKLMGA